MPLYTYKCEKCGHEDFEIRTVEERNDSKVCENTEDVEDEFEQIHKVICGGEMKLKIGNPPFKFINGAR